MSEGPPGESASAGSHVNRREFVGSLGAVTIAGLAGCGGDDGGGDGENGGGGTPAAAGSPTVVRGVDRYDTTVALTIPISRAEFQHQRYGTLNPGGFGDILSFDLANRSYGDNSMYGELIDEWSYDGGQLDVTLHEDFTYWSGEPVDAENVMVHYELQQFRTRSGDAHPSIDALERTGEYELRFSLAEDWREEYAVDRSVGGWSPRGSTAYYEEWLEKFRDAANDDEVTEVLANLVQTGENDAAPFYNGPFRITGGHENRVDCELRLDETPVPHFVDDINFTKLELKLVNPQRSMEPTGLFNDGWRPMAASDEIEGASPSFETVRAAFPPRTGQWSLLFNCRTPPGSNPRFRRAINYATDRKSMRQPSDVLPNRRHTPFATPEREERYVGEDVREALEDFRWDEAEMEAATREMEAGGFERDSEGQWLYREGEEAGEPMDVRIIASPAQTALGDRVGQFRRELGDWGMTIAVQAVQDYRSRLDAGSNFTVAATRWGGGVPERALPMNFARDTAGSFAVPGLPATLEAPPVSEQWPTVEELESYDVRTMARSVRTTGDDGTFQELVDRLTWVYNQTTPRIGVELPAGEYAFNTTRFDVALPADAPSLWTRPPPDRVATTGIVDYVPQAER